MLKTSQYDTHRFALQERRVWISLKGFQSHYPQTCLRACFLTACSHRRKCLDGAARWKKRRSCAFGNGNAALDRLSGLIAAAHARPHLSLSPPLALTHIQDVMLYQPTERDVYCINNDVISYRPLESLYRSMFKYRHTLTLLELFVNWLVPGVQQRLNLRAGNSQTGVLSVICVP